MLGKAEPARVAAAYAAEGGATRRVLVRVGGMSCAGCEDAIRRAIEPLDGVRSVSASTAEGAAHVEFAAPCTTQALERAIDASGYELLGVEEERGEAPDRAGAAVPLPQRSSDALYLVIIAAGLFVVAQNLGVNRLFQAIPTISGQGLGYVALFGIGLLTSVHCIAMCGGINLAQSTALGEGVRPEGAAKAGATAGAAAVATTATTSSRPNRRASLALAPSLRYNAGRLVSYTLIGGLLGAVGQVASIGLGARAAVGLIAGSFMLLAGLGMAGAFPFLARLAPRVPAPLRRAAASFARRGPFALGLVNGLMPCGPLQAMQAYAIGTGSPLAGALSLAAFCAGTIPLVLAFGVVAGTLGRRWRHVMLRAAAVMMVIFGLFMVQSNLAIVGVRLPGFLGASSSGSQMVAAQQSGGVQTVTTELRADGYDSIQVRAGVPVRWTIHAAAGTLNGCNAEMVLPDFNQQVKLAEGDTTIEFTPTAAGTYNFSCWMGMLHGQIVAS